MPLWAGIGKAADGTIGGITSAVTGNDDGEGDGDGDGKGGTLDVCVADGSLESAGATIETAVLHFGQGTDLPIMVSFAWSRTAQFGQRTINGIEISNRFRIHAKWNIMGCRAEHLVNL